MAAASAQRPALTAAILVGGASRRMGADKASLVFAGKTLLARAAATLARLTDDVVVVARDATQPIPFVTTPLRVVADRVAGAGPLGGLDAALAASRAEVLLVLPIDMPLLSAAVLELMVRATVDDAELDAVVLRCEGETRPLPLVCRTRIAPAVTASLADGERRLSALLRRISARAIPEGRWLPLDPGGRSMLNANSPLDLVGRRD